jgi:hypothetical protein
MMKRLVKWDEEISNLILEKKQAYLKFLQLRTPETRTEYMRRRAELQSREKRGK